MGHKAGAQLTPRAPGALEGLNPSDPGVLLLSHRVAKSDPAQLLLVHCGDLPGIGRGATRLILDVRERTGSPHECVSDIGADGPDQPGADGHEPALPFGERRFETATLWPRAHLGKDFSEACLGLACLGLREGGELLCAVRKQKGGRSLGRVMRALLGEHAVEVVARDRGYHLWSGRRGDSFNAGLAAELSGRSYTIEDPALGALTLRSRPGVFSRKELDAGSRALIHVGAALLDQERAAGRPAPRRVLDLCAGIGPLGLWAASRDKATQVLAIESNLRACALIESNAHTNGLTGQLQVLESDGLPEALPPPFDRGHPFDLVLLNPPTHADSDSLARLLDLRALLAPGGLALIVVKRAERAVEILTQSGAHIEGGEREGYFLLQASWGKRR